MYQNCCVIYNWSSLIPTDIDRDILDTTDYGVFSFLTKK